ncbi:MULTISPECIES: HTH domain-containing protein [Parvimonas]|uniref:HTH domain-containing protein n=1 Tax=Parvimonas parva TaxID=2769485 RepID=A0ABS1CAN3_9FIRM|nr:MULTISPECIES: HTH domain-containing protein [Parvimonas]MBK1469096.1 HTH domain-containing protein [Parvimonas parva]
MELNEKIIELLKSSEPLKGGEIAEKLGVDKSDVDKVLKKLKSEEKIISPKRCYYSVEK